jgi:hypothetical protein
MARDKPQAKALGFGIPEARALRPTISQAIAMPRRAGGPAPEVLGEVSLEGRCGIVLPRLEGPTLLQLTKSGAITFERAGAILASLFLAVRNTPPPPDVLPLRDLMNGSSLLSGGAVPRHIATGILALIERLRPGDGLCHGDLHPDNVMMTAMVRELY